MSVSFEINLPDLFSLCPFPISLHPQYKKVSLESNAWIGTYDVLRSDTYSFFTRIDTPLLGSYVYPYATYDKLRIVGDLINMTFAMDAISDEQDGVAARSTMDLHVKVLLSGRSDDSAMTQMTLSFRERAMEQFGPNSLRRFLTNYKNYCEAVGTEAAYRDRGMILSLEEYRIFRRENGGVKPFFDLIEPCSGIDLPDMVFEDPTFKRIYNAALDMILWPNDIYSYQKEQTEPGCASSNYITVVMKEKGLTIQQAFDYAGAEFQSLVSQFIKDKLALPSFGAAVDADLKYYIAGLESWVSGHLQFSFETQRYFGEDREEVKKTLIVKLLKQDDAF
ncbi:hypothetical protein EW145_g1025 [Phellinidium pouzarii]|uniref:Terpene synthase n=1 Tax=Phellinidium pouzarii TaxID=167371 RepID=A0A4S4LLL1_9AGAM|nr:hypothetical protein EW145_g1025 [Phellinidium pouzarii]